MALLLILCSLSVHANPWLVPDGYGQTTGPVTNLFNIRASSYNPANIRQMVREDQSFRMGIMPNLGVGVKFGDMDKLNTLQDDVEKEIDSINKSCTIDITKINKTSIISGLGTNPTQAAIEAALKAAIDAQLDDCLKQTNDKLIPFNTNLLPRLNAMDVQMQGHLGFPLTPILFKASPLSDGWAFSVAQYMQARIKVATDDVAVKKKSGTVYNYDDLSRSKVDIEVFSNSAINGQVVGVSHLSLGYSHPLDQFAPASLADDLTDLTHFDVGLRLNYYLVNADRIARALVKDNKTSFDSDIKTHFKQTSLMGVDAGLLWTAPLYQLGVTVYNANSPSFSYPSINTDSPNLKTIAMPDTIKIKAQSVVEASVYTPNKLLMLQASKAMNMTSDFIGEAQQWQTISAGIYPSGFWIPSLRVGYQKNQVGTQLQRYTAGLTLFGLVNLDFYRSKQVIKDDKNNEVPRSAGFALGITKSF